MPALVQRVKVGSYYTDKIVLVEVVGVNKTGSVDLENAMDGATWTCAEAIFRARFELVREAEVEA